MTQIDSCSISPYKMAIVVRQDLKMGKGKIAAQVGHASIEGSEIVRKENRSLWKEWIQKGQCKVVLKVASLAEINKLVSKASKLDLSVAIIQDKGLTQIPANTLTCIAIGPGPTKLIDDVTGHLRLL
ncbi:peptidyl-tRNA hydrolase Pth2 [[Eubacterium] cellulosolvens]